jgi:chaperonin cofactor prefoldin
MDFVDALKNWIAEHSDLVAGLRDRMEGLEKQNAGLQDGMQNLETEVANLKELTKALQPAVPAPADPPAPPAA